MAKDGKTIQSIDRAFEILKCFESSEEMGVTEISKSVGLHKSTTFNIIYTLERAGLLIKNESSNKYRLGIELFRLGTLVDSNLRNICRPYLERLVEEFSETVNLVAHKGNHVIYLEKIESPHSMRISTREGQQLPLYSTAVGKAMMATFRDDELARIMENFIFTPFTSNTVRNVEELMVQLNSIREKGYAEDLEEYELGLTCIASPILDYSQKAKFAISVSGPQTRMDFETRERIGRTLSRYAEEISRKMGF